MDVRADAAGAQSGPGARKPARKSAGTAARHKPVKSTAHVTGAVAAGGKPAHDLRQGEALWLDDAARWAMLGIFALLFVFALSAGAFFLMPVTVGVVIGLTFGPLVDGLERRGLPPYVASAAMVCLVGGLLDGLFLAFAIPLEEWSIRIPEVVDRAHVHLYALRPTLDRLHELGRTVKEATAPGSRSLEVALEGPGIVTGILASAPALLAQLLIALGTFFFFLANRNRLRVWLLLLPVSQGVRYRIARFFRDTEYYLSRYVATIALINIGLGTATGFAMWLLGVPTPALWGALAALFNFVPYLGPALVAVILLGVSLVSFDDLSAALVPPGIFLALNLLEGQFVTPAVLGQRLTLNPFLVFMALAFWVWLWGPVGAFLAVPLLVIATVMIVHCTSNGEGESLARFGRPAAQAAALGRAR